MNIDDFKSLLRKIMPLIYVIMGGMVIYYNLLDRSELSTSIGILFISYGVYRAAIHWRKPNDANQWVWLFFLATPLTSCQKQQGPKLDTPTTGQITVAIDESYQPVFDAAITVFDSIYTRAAIFPAYAPMQTIVEDLLTDSVQVVVLPRELNESELAYFKKRQFTPRITLIAKDGLALISHPSNQDSILTVEEVRQILTGEKKSWKDVQKNTDKGAIQIVFDNNQSGTVAYAIDSICRGQALSQQNAFAVKNSAEVVNYVASNPNAIGIIGVNWISDMDDPQAQDFLKKIKVIGISRAEGKEAFQPFQAYIATGQYPFIRNIYFINAQARSGLGMGFASFLANERGQRIVLKSGLLPATQPIRLVRMN